MKTQTVTSCPRTERGRSSGAMMMPRGVGATSRFSPSAALPAFPLPSPPRTPGSTRSCGGRNSTQFSAISGNGTSTSTGSINGTSGRGGIQISDRGGRTTETIASSPGAASALPLAGPAADSPISTIVFDNSSTIRCSNTESSNPRRHTSRSRRTRSPIRSDGIVPSSITVVIQN